MGPTGLQKAAVERLVTEFQYLRSQAVEPLSTFLDFITYEYMIENVMLLLKGTLSGRDINELIAQCHPLGMFKESTMRSIPTFESTPRGYQDLYQTVLVDTPVGPYSSLFLKETAGRGEVSNVLEEVEIEIIKSTLIKFWIEDFANYVESLGGETATIMGDLLMWEMKTSWAVSSHCSPIIPPSGTSTPPADLTASLSTTHFMRATSKCLNSRMRDKCTMVRSMLTLSLRNRRFVIWCGLANVSFNSRKRKSTSSLRCFRSMPHGVRGVRSRDVRD